jgi:hypothetical protein
LLNVPLRVTFVLTLVLLAAASTGPIFEVKLPHGIDFTLENSPTLKSI